MTQLEVTLDTYKPMTVEEALSRDLPGDMIELHREDVSLARQLTREMSPGMSEFQIKEFVMGDIPDRVTPHGLCQQALREIGGRYEAILSLQFEWEKMQAQVRLLQATIEWANKRKETMVSEDVAVANAKIDLQQAKLNDLLRRMPLVDNKARDLFRQLQAFLAEYNRVAALLPTGVDKETLDRLEWEARYIVRCWKGRLNYLPGHFDPNFHMEAIELAIYLREHKFTTAEVREVASQTDFPDRWAKAEKITEETGKTLPALDDFQVPIDASDELFGMMIQRRQIEYRKQVEAAQQPPNVIPANGFRPGKR